MRKLFFLILFLSLWAAPAQAAVYWASTTGSGATCGTTGTSDPGSGYTTLAKGVTCLAAGDTLNLKGGTYPDSNRIITNSGTSFSNPITIKNAPSEMVTFIGTLVFDVYSGSFHHIIFDGSDGNATPCSTGACTTNLVFAFGTGNANITIVGAHHLRYKGVEIKNATTNGFQPTNSTSGIELINSRIHHNGVVSTQEHGTYWNSVDGIIDGNDLYSNCAAGIHAYTADFPHTNDNLIIRNNRARLNGACGGASHGILSTAGDNQRIYNNIVHDNNGTGITLYNTFPPDGAVVYNNTVYNNSGTGLYLYPGPAATGTIWRNNISSNNTPNINWSAGSVTSSNNMCSGAAAGCNLVESASTTFNDFTNFILKTGSAAINAGTIGIAPGITIPVCSGGTTNCYIGALPDLGAIETGVPTLGGGPPTLTPHPASVAAGAPILLTVDDDDINERAENPVDWIGLYVPGSSSYDWIDWLYMNGTKIAPLSPISDAVVPFTAPLTLGAYEFRFYANGSALETDRLATAGFTVIPPGIVMKFNISALKIGPNVTWKIGVP